MLFVSFVVEDPRAALTCGCYDGDIRRVPDCVRAPSSPLESTVQMVQPGALTMMQRMGFSFLIMGLMTATVVVAADKVEDKSAAVRPTDNVIKIFNGKSLDGLYTFLKDTKYKDPRRVFRVTDGMLHITGDGLGGILTKKQYRDYHLVLEFKWGKRTWKNRKTRTKDSGLLIHSVGADGGYGGIWMPSIEVQMIEGGCGDFIMVAGKDKQGKTVPIALTCEVDRDRDGEVIWKPGGKRERFDLKNRRRINWYGRDPDWKDEIGFRGKQDVESPDGQWNRFDVICKGGHIQVFVNGKKVNEAFDSYPTQGRLQLQTELAEVFVRRWELHPLGKGPKPAPPAEK